MLDSNSKVNPRRRSLLAGAVATPVLATGLAGCAASRQPAGPVVALEQPRARVGDRWVYREINRYNGLPLADVEVTVTAESPLTCNVRRTRSDTTAGEIARPDAILVERYAQPWVVDLEPTYDLTMDFAEPMPIVPASAQAGQAQTSRTRYTVPGYSGSFAWMQRLKVTGSGRIATPAGNFDCVEVERRIWFDYPDVFRFNSARVDRIWYAPQVNRWVRREWTGDYLHENSLDDRGNIRRREDWVRWDLLSYTPAAGAAG
jgi:hypothetical protein